MMTHFFFKWNEVKFLRNRNQKFVNHMWIDALNNWNMKNHWQRSSQNFSFEMFNVKYNIRALRKSKYDIQTKKMNVVFYDFRKWLNQIQYTRLIIHCDNFSMICDFKKNFIHDSFMIFFRKIAMLLIIHDIDIDDVV